MNFEILKSEQFSHIPHNFLLQMCNQLRNLFDQQLTIKFSNSNSLLGSGQYSILQGNFLIFSIFFLKKKSHF